MTSTHSDSNTRVESSAIASALNHSDISFGVAVTSGQARPCGTGQLADSYQVRLEYVDGAQGPDSIFVKLPPTDAHSASTAQRINAFGREHYFYTDLLPHLDINTPRFLGTIELPDGTTGLVLEDLADTTRPLDQLADGTVTQATSVLSGLAGLQAPFWNDVDAAGGAGHFYNRTTDHIHGLADRYQQSWHQYRDSVGAGLDQNLRELIELFGEHCIDWAASISGPQTLTHQDLRLDNLLWSDESGAVLIDWQTLAFTTPAWDPAFFLGTALRPEDRREVERGLIRSHVDNLAERGISDWGFDTAWTEHRRLSGSVLLAMVAALAFVAPTDRGFDMFASLIVRGAQQAVDLDLREFLN